MSRPYLLLDCYLDATGGAGNLLPLLAGRSARVVRPAYEPLPASAEDFAGLVISGSAASLLDPPPWTGPLLGLIQEGAQRGIPVLGICFGHQAIARALCGPDAVRRSRRAELGWLEIELCGRDPLFAGFERRFACFVSHLDEVTPGSAGIDVLAKSERCAVQGFRVRGKPIWGVQFHAEMGPAEAEAVLRSNLPRHAELGSDPEPLLAAAVDGREAARALLGSFLALAESRAAGAARP